MPDRRNRADNLSRTRRGDEKNKSMEELDAREYHKYAHVTCRPTNEKSKVAYTVFTL